MRRKGKVKRREKKRRREVKMIRRARRGRRRADKRGKVILKKQKCNLHYIHL